MGIDFDKIVEARANERVQNRIYAFTQEAFAAALKLCDGGVEQGRREVLAVAAQPYAERTWPQSLWTKERATVRKELLATMDEMQRAIVAAEKAEPGEHRSDGETT